MIVRCGLKIPSESNCSASRGLPRSTYTSSYKMEISRTDKNRGKPCPVCKNYFSGLSTLYRINIFQACSHVTESIYFRPVHTLQNQYFQACTIHTLQNQYFSDMFTCYRINIFQACPHSTESIFFKLVHTLNQYSVNIRSMGL